MATGDKTASFTLKVDAQSNARQGATELEQYRSKIETAQDAVKSYGASLRQLRGASDEVKAAKGDLKAKIDAEREAISRASLAILKGGSTYEALSRAQKKAAAEAKAVADAAKKDAGSSDALKRSISELGGPLSTLQDELGSVKTLFGGATTVAGGFAIGIGVAAIAVTALAAALVAGTAVFGRWVVSGANALRTMGLMREAAGGSAANATALGHQIDALAAKIATPKTELNELANAMTRSLLGTRVSGQGIVDTFNAVAQASEAMGKEVGSQIQSIITRGKQWGRMSLGLFELQGTGITFADVAKNLAKQLGISLQAAQFQLVTGYAKIDDGAKAIRTAIETRFAGINLRKMLDLDVIKQKFHETLTALTGGVNLEPLLGPIKGLADLFSESTMAGAAMKDIVTDLGNALVGKAASGTKLLTSGIKQLVIWAYQVDIAFLKSKKGINDFLAPISKIVTMKDVVFALKGAAVGLGLAVASTAIAVATFVAAFKGIETVWDTFNSIDDFVSNLGERMRASMANVGHAVVDGLTAGIRSGWDSLKSGVSSMADKIKNTFKAMLGIHSPSKAFEEYGEQVPAGAAKGINAKGPAVQRAVDAMAPSPPIGLAGAAAGRLGGPTVGAVELHFHFEGATHNAQEIERTLRAPDLLAALTKAVEDALKSVGIPTQTVEAT